MKGRVLVLFVAATLVVSTVPAPVAAAEDPRFETIVPEPQLTPGAEQVVTVELINDDEDVDDRVKTASNVRVEPSVGETPFDVLSGTQRVGTMTDGEPHQVGIRLIVPRSSPAGEYDLPLAITYEYDGDERETTTVTARVEVPERPVFEVRDVSGTSSLGETGTVTLTMSNNGSATAWETRLRLETASSSLAVDGTNSVTRHVGDWPAGENRSVTFDVRTAEDASLDDYAVSVTPTYTDDNDVVSSAGPLSFGVSPAPRQSFDIDEVSATVYGDTITLESTLTNTGNRTVRNVLTMLSSEHSDVRVTDATATAGTLEPGETTMVTFELRRAPDATAESRTFTAAVQYQRDDDQWYRSRDVALQVDLPEETDVLELEPVNNTFGIDESNSFTVRVTNAGDEPLTDVHARLGVHPPYESNAPTSYVASLDPGESAILRFEVTTPDDAVETTDALPVTINATTGDDRDISTGPTLVEFHIDGGDGATGNTTNLVIGGFVVVLVLVAGWWWLNQ